MPRMTATSETFKDVIIKEIEIYFGVAKCLGKKLVVDISLEEGGSNANSRKKGSVSLPAQNKTRID
ncbi:MAG: hypothetical protein WDA47_04160 [Bacilli bacterium]|jgi:hypothetical protein